jgi:DNA-binding MarR family transcriptional regulator
MPQGVEVRRVDYERADALNRAIRLLGMSHRALAAAGLAELGLHPGQELLLLELDAHGPRNQRQLADGLSCEPPSVTLMVQKLEAAGLIRRTPSASDGRATVVELTEAGHALMPRLKAVWQRLAERTAAGLDSASLDHVVEVVGDLGRTVSAGRRGGDGPRAALVGRPGRHQR